MFFLDIIIVIYACHFSIAQMKAKCIRALFKE